MKDQVNNGGPALAVFSTLSSIQPQWHDSTPARPSKEMACEFIATLARQLAEARSEAGEVIKYQQRAWHAESQLAEATRRLGEVEGLAGKWREEAPNTQSSYDIHNRYGDALENCADELEAALTKEPTK